MTVDARQLRPDVSNHVLQIVEDNAVWAAGIACNDAVVEDPAVEIAILFALSRGEETPTPGTMAKDASGCDRCCRPRHAPNKILYNAGAIVLELVVCDDCATDLNRSFAGLHWS